MYYDVLFWWILYFVYVMSDLNVVSVFGVYEYVKFYGDYDEFWV